MSYILDALRRADSERERGAVPGLHAQPVPAHWRDPRGARRAKPWVGATVGVSVVVLGTFAWHMAGRETTPAVAPSASPPATPVAAAPASDPQAAAMQPHGVPAPASTTAMAPAAPRAPAAAPAAAAVAGPAAAPPVTKADRPHAAALPAEPARRKGTPAAPPTETAARPVAKSEPAPAPSAAEGRAPAQSELPPDIRRQLPNLAIGGSMYSENPTSRMLIVNGQLVHEGDTLAPGLSLEQIKLKSAILRFKGHRYEISY
jgi:general secretion pathway protein B